MAFKKDNIKTSGAHIATVDKSIEDIRVSFKEYEYLLSIRGFGPNVSAVVLPEYCMKISEKFE